MIVMGIDPSLTRTGIAVIQAETGTFVMADAAVSPDVELDEMVRYELLSNNLDVAIRGYSPDLVVVESEIWVRVGSQSSQASVVQYLVKRLLWQYRQQTRYLPVGVQQVKKWLGVKEKNQSLLQVYKLYGQEFAEHDLAEALALAHIGRGFLYPNTVRNKAQGEVIAKLAIRGLPWEQPPPAPKPERRKKKAEPPSPSRPVRTPAVLRAD